MPLHYGLFWKQGHSIKCLYLCDRYMRYVWEQQPMLFPCPWYPANIWSHSGYTLYCWISCATMTSTQGYTPLYTAKNRWSRAVRDVNSKTSAGQLVPHLELGSYNSPPHLSPWIYVDASNPVAVPCLRKQRLMTHSVKLTATSNDPSTINY